MADDGQWWWCLTHERAEQGSDCALAERLGPYASEEAARSYAERAAARTEAWDREDEEWREGRRRS